MSKPTFLAPLIGKSVGQCELVYAERGSVLAREVEPAFDSKSRKKGMLGRESIPSDYALVIAPCGAVHTFSMRVPIDLVFVARNGTITKTIRGVKPWRIAGSMGAHAVIEAAEGFIDRHELVPGEVVALRELPRYTEGEAEPARRVTPTPISAPPPSRRSDGLKAATLADLIARRVAIEWFEGVAIVQELCAAVLASESAQEQRVPELAQIAITPEGEVKLLGKGPRAQWLVHRVGAVLLALVPEQQLPLQLRLLALEEVSPAPKFPSIRNLTTELEFFERPDRRQIVQGVYERYRRMTTPEALAKAVPPPLLEPAPPRRTATGWWKRKSTRVSIAVGLVAAASMGLAWEWQRPEGRWLRDSAGEVSAATAEAAQWTRGRASQGLEAAKGVLGFDEPVSTPPGPGARFIDSSRTRATPPPAGPEPLPAQPVQGAVQAGAAAGAPPVGLPADVESGIWEAVGWVPGTVPPPSPGESTIFTSADARVVPAGLVRPRVPIGERAGGAQDELPEVELVISTTGEVESVRLVSPVGGTRTAMMLSAIKTWRFQPATLNGDPVRFRFRMKLIG